MHTNFKSLIIEINKFDFVFIVCQNFENGSFNILHKSSTPIRGILNNKISDFKAICELIKKNIFLIEQKLDLIFKEVILIINNFNISVINLSGFKKLNGSQLLKENITYILNSLKQKISEIEKDKTIVHIFNSKYLLDQEKTKNLPIGLFGNFYSHELSFFLIKNNDFKNLRNILSQCNLRIKKIMSKNFIEGAHLINKNFNLETFFKIEINKDNSQIFFFENSALKFVQNFAFGSNIILSDISKITALEIEVVKNILNNSNFVGKSIDQDFIEKTFFEDKNYRKIQKKLLVDIVRARIQEISEIMIFKNINVSSFLKKEKKIFLNLEDTFQNESLNRIYIDCFSRENIFNINFLDSFDSSDIYHEASKIVQFGWKKEAIPVTLEKKSLISRLFGIIFK